MIKCSKIKQKQQIGIGPNKQKKRSQRKSVSNTSRCRETHVHTHGNSKDRETHAHKHGNSTKTKLETLLWLHFRSSMETEQSRSFFMYIPIRQSKWNYQITGETEPRLDTSHNQIQTPVPEMGSIYSSCCLRGSLGNCKTTQAGFCSPHTDSRAQLLKTTPA